MAQAELAIVIVVFGFLAVATEAQKKDYKPGIACEGQQIELNKCPERHVIKIDSAIFGRKKNVICSGRANYTTNCGMTDVRHRVKAMCDERNKCSFAVDTDLLGDVKECSYVSKYLIVHYLCLPTTDEEDECVRPVVKFDPDHHENTFLDTSSDDSARFSAKYNNSALGNDHELRLIMLGVLGVIYSFK